MPKRSPEKQFELDKCLAIMLATIDYNSEREIGSMVCDGYDPLIEIYEWQRGQARKLHAQGRLDRLQNKLEGQTRFMSASADAVFEAYIKARTGYDIDLVADLKEEVDTIFAWGKIDTDLEASQVWKFLGLSRNRNEEEEKRERLTELLLQFHKSRRPARARVFTRSYETEDMLVQEVTIVTGGGDMRDYDRQSSQSPDGRKRLSLSRYSTRSAAYTSIHLSFPKGSCCIFQANVNSAKISATWKDHHNISIRTSKEFETPIRVQQVESYGERVSIVYEDISRD